MCRHPHVRFARAQFFPGFRHGGPGLDTPPAKLWMLLIDSCDLLNSLKHTIEKMFAKLER